MAEELKTYKLNEKNARTIGMAADALKAAQGRINALLQTISDTMEVPEGFVFDIQKMEFVTPPTE